MLLHKVQDLSNIFTTPLFYLSGESISLLWILQILGLFIFVSILARIVKRLLKYLGNIL